MLQMAARNRPCRRLLPAAPACWDGLLAREADWPRAPAPPAARRELATGSRPRPPRCAAQAGSARCLAWRLQPRPWLRRGWKGLVGRTGSCTSTAPCPPADEGRLHRPAQPAAGGPGLALRPLPGAAARSGRLGGRRCSLPGIAGGNRRPQLRSVDTCRPPLTTRSPAARRVQQGARERRRRQDGPLPQLWAQPQARGRHAHHARGAAAGRPAAVQRGQPARQPAEAQPRQPVARAQDVPVGAAGARLWGEGCCCCAGGCGHQGWRVVGCWPA